MWWYMFFTVYGVLLSTQGIFWFFAVVPYPWAEYPAFQSRTWTFDLHFSVALGLIAQLLFNVIAFIIDAIVARHLEIDENMNPIQNLLHVLLSPFVHFFHCLIAFFATLYFIVGGKPAAERGSPAGPQGSVGSTLVRVHTEKISRAVPKSECGSSSRSQSSTHVPIDAAVFRENA